MKLVRLDIVELGSDTLNPKESNADTPLSRMSIKFYDPELEQQFRQYVDLKSSTNIKVVNDIFEAVFAIQNQFDNDTLENLKEISNLIDSINWDEIREIHQDLKRDFLTQHTPISNLILAMIQKGIDAYKLSKKSQLTPHQS
ncbi:MAG: hypothetical protein AAFW84_09885 [Cyanobacteria bacterium J06635_15]